MENLIENDNDSDVVHYINNYLDCVENLPNDLQRQLSRILDLDTTSQSCLREFAKQQKIVTNDKVDIAVRTQALTEMQESLISLQNTGDEKLNLVQIILNTIEKKVEQLNMQRKKLNIKEQENNEPLNGSSTNFNSSLEKNQKLNLRGRKSKLNISSKSDVTDTSVLSENQFMNISSSSSGTQKKTNNGNNGKKTKRKSYTNQSYQDDIQSLTEDDPDEPIYCLCRQISYGKMILCDNDSCKIEWFHFKCVSLTKKPKGKWYCPQCRGFRPNIMKSSKTEN